MTTPFADAALAYLERGWSVFPLPAGAKQPPPKGYTGYGARRATQADVEKWAKATPAANLGVWAAPGILGIDVDAYVKAGTTKTGDATIAELEKVLGPLPATWVSSARALPSGIHWFRVPVEVELFITKLVGVEFIQSTHRYGVVPHSTHPEIGEPYWWHVKGRRTRRIPKVSELAELPPAWVEHLTRDGAKSRTTGVRGDDLDLADARAWLAEHGAGSACRAVRGVLRAHVATMEDGTSRYQNAIDGQMALLHLVVEGHPGVAWAMPQLKTAYLEAVAGEDRDTEAEWRRGLATGIAKQIEAGEPAPHHPDGKCPQMTAPSDPSVWPAPSAPYDVADRYVREVYDVEGSPTLRYWRGDFYTWRGSHWLPFDVKDLTAEIASVLRHASYVGSAATPTELPWRPTPPKLKQVVDSLSTLTHCLRSTETEADDSSAAGITFANGVLDMDTRALNPHSPAWFNLTALPYDYDPHAPAPAEWLKFLKSLWGDGDQIQLLQEWIGYLISGRTDMQKMLFLIGVSGAGKGVIMKVCEALVGSPDNHASLRVDSLVATFGLEKTIGKTLITMGDARFSSKTAQDALPTLLNIVGEDRIPVNRKNRITWDGILPGRFMISTNEPPNIPDLASALKRRTLLLYFTEDFVGREDRGLFGRLLRELPGILNWALEGYDRLVSLGSDTDTWTEPESSRAIKDEMEEMGAPVKQFMRECCKPVADVSTPKATLYEAWSRWCDDNGKHPTSSPVFFRDLYAAYPKLRQVRQGSGRSGSVLREQAVAGVELMRPLHERGDLR